MTISLEQFQQKKQKYYEACHPTQPPEGYEATTAEIKENGFSILRGFYSPEQIMEIKNEILQTGKIYQNDFSLLAPIDLPKFQGTYSLVIDSSLPHANSFIQSPIIRGIARSIVTHHLDQKRTVVLALQDTNLESANIWHIDGWRFKFKAFLFLDPVTKNDAPTEILQASHKGNWNEDKKFQFEKYFAKSSSREIYASEEAEYVGCYFPADITDIQEQYDFKRIICTGNPGDVLLLDTRTVHRRLPLHSKSRLVIMNSFSHDFN